MADRAQKKREQEEAEHTRALEYNLSADEQDAVARGREIIERLPQDIENLRGHYYGLFLACRPLRREAILLSCSKKGATGGRYSKSFNFLLVKAGLINPNDPPAKDFYGEILWIYDEAIVEDLEKTRSEILDNILLAMSPAQRLKLVTPNAMKKRIQAMIKELLKTKAKADGTVSAKPKVSAAQEKKIADAKEAKDKDGRIAHLEEQLAHANGGGQLDYESDTPAHCFAVLMSNPRKFRQLVAMYHAKEKTATPPAKPKPTKPT
jgi:hypothetical protein